MAIKIGKFYITRNNPRELLRTNADKQNKIDKAIEIIDLITPELWNISNKMTYRLKDIKYILKGGSDE